MRTSTIILLVILIALIAALVFLYFTGRRMQKRQEEQEQQIQATKQPVTLLVIDKKRMKLKESGLPQEVIDGTPWYARRQKVPMVRAKVGPQYLNLMCDDKIFDLIPVKKQVKAMVSGIYIVEVKGMRGARLTPDENAKKKSGFRRRLEKLQEKAGAKPVK